MNLQARVERVRCLTALGHLDEADALAAGTVDRARLMRSRRSLHLALSAQVEVLVAAGDSDIDAALTVGAEAVALDTHPARRMSAPVRRELAVAQLEAGRAPRCLAELDDAGMADDALEPGKRARYLEARIRVALLVGDVGVAVEAGERLGGSERDPGRPLSRAIARRSRARLLLATTTGDAPGDLADALARLGRYDDAMRALTAAIAVLDDRHAQRWRDEARRQLRRLRRAQGRPVGARSRRPDRTR